MVIMSASSTLSLFLLIIDYLLISKLRKWFSKFFQIISKLIEIEILKNRVFVCQVYGGRENTLYSVSFLGTDNEAMRCCQFVET